MTWLNTVRHAGSLQRFHTKPLLHKQDIAQHSFNCVFLAMELCQGVEDVDKDKIIRYLLTHDLAEVETGDASGKAKKDHPKLKQVLDEIEEEWYNKNLPSYFKDCRKLTEKEKYICKMADLLEGLTTALIEVNLGNKYLESAVDDLKRTLMVRGIETKDDHVHDNYLDIYYGILNEWEEE